VRKAPLPLADEVRPLAPVAVEAIRAAMLARDTSPSWRHWDATLISVLAYAGVRPQEARALRWGHVHERTLIANAEKTRSRRSVRLLAPLRADLAEWRMACGRPGDREWVFPGDDGGQWTATAYALWRARRFADALPAARQESDGPLCTSPFVRFPVPARRTVIYVAPARCKTRGGCSARWGERWAACG
jgi:integrase